jgi:hypothetical protein
MSRWHYALNKSHTQCLTEKAHICIDAIVCCGETVSPDPYNILGKVDQGYQYPHCTGGSKTWRIEQVVEMVSQTFRHLSQLCAFLFRNSSGIRRIRRFAAAGDSDSAITARICAPLLLLSSLSHRTLRTLKSLSLADSCTTPPLWSSSDDQIWINSSMDSIPGHRIDVS